VSAIELRILLWFINSLDFFAQIAKKSHEPTKGRGGGLPLASHSLSQWILPRKGDRVRVRVGGLLRARRQDWETTTTPKCSLLLSMCAELTLNTFLIQHAQQSTKHRHEPRQQTVMSADGASLCCSRALSALWWAHEDIANYRAQPSQAFFLHTFQRRHSDTQYSMLKNC
jgi:hypothetical protein